MSDQIPQGQQYQCKGNVSQQGSGGDADDGIAEQVHQVGNGADNAAGENRFAQLLTHNIGEEEGVHGTEEGTGHSNYETKDQIQQTGGHHEQQQNQQNRGSISYQSLRQIGPEAPACQQMQHHTENHRQKPQHQPCAELFPFRHKGIQQIHEKCQDDQGKNLRAEGRKLDIGSPKIP